MFDGTPAPQRSVYTRKRPAVNRGVVWTRTERHYLAKIAVPSPDPSEWRSLLDQLRPSVRPLVLWMPGRVWLGAAGRDALAAAIGSSKVAVIVENDIGRGLATALEWLGINVTAYSSNELERAETELEFQPGQLGELLEALA